MTPITFVTWRCYCGNMSKSSDVLNNEMEPANLNAILLAPILESMSKNLTDMSRRNRQINYKPRKVGTLDLQFADPKGLSDLYSGAETKLSLLFPFSSTSISGPDAELDDEAEVFSEVAEPAGKVNPEARKSARRLFESMRELAEEKGLDSLFLAHGALSWTSDEGNLHLAPIFIIQANIEPFDGKRTDFKISVDFASGAAINPSLIDYLIVNKGLNWDEDYWLELLEGKDLKQSVRCKEEFLALVKQILPDSKEENLEVLDTFTFAKAPMVKDLRDPEFLALASQNAIILAATGVDGTFLPSPDENIFDYVDIDTQIISKTPLILDADAHQQLAIETVLRGQNLVIQGPPGTGKSQTIANLIAALTENGKTVLFVAEKAAAIDAVAKRLKARNLGHLMLKLHETGARKSATYNQINQSLETGKRLAISNQDIKALTTNRNQLNKRTEILHTPINSIGYSPFELIEIASSKNQKIKLFDENSRRNLTRLSKLLVNQCEQSELLARQLSQSGFLDKKSASSQWNLARPNPELDLDDFRTVIEDTCSKFTKLLKVKIRLPSPLKKYYEVPNEELLPTLTSAIRLLEAEAGLAYPVSDEQLAQFLAAFKIPSEINKLNAPLGWYESWSMRRRARKYLPEHSNVVEGIVELESARILWSGFSKNSIPTSDSLDYLKEIEELITETLNALSSINIITSGVLDTDVKALQLLSDDFNDAWKAQTWCSNELRLIELGLGAGINKLFASDISEETCKEIVTSAAAEALLVDLMKKETSLSMQNVQSVVDAYVKLDQKFIFENAQRVARKSAEHALSVRNSYPDQNTVVMREITKKSRQLSTRELFHKTPDIVTAITPCVAMSPLMVSTLLPIKEMFDVVIFDEASQVLPSDALSSIVRGRQLVVAGDSRQLPPTTFFDSGTTTGETDLEDFESILDLLSNLLPSRSLLWHYRSLDERLIAVSNQHIYDGQLTTFPGAERSKTLRFVHATDSDTALMGTHSSNSSEIETLIEEIFNHAELYPNESLGVITLGREHANRVEMAFRKSLSDRPDLMTYFSDESSERFFIKNLERVQGDERDNIIISTGYQKNQSGKLPQNFGPINQNGGQRRLNVAMSRARKRMTLVSSFQSSDIDASTNKRGVEVLHAFFTFMESGGTNLLTGRHGDIPLNPFESAILERMVGEGLVVEPQLGVSGYRIDFAVRHPSLLGRYILAVEADGASYHSEKSARDRDRLRQEHLERLGWKFHRIWSTDWFRDPAREIDRLVCAYQEQLEKFESGISSKQVPNYESEDVKSLQVNQPIIQRTLSSFNVYGKSISQVSQHHIDACVKQVIEMTGLITREEAIEEARKALGYSRKGPAIIQVLSRSYDRVNKKH